MKKYKLELLFVFSVLATLLLALFTSCDDHNGINNPRNIEFDSPLYAIVDFTDLQNAIQNASLNNDMIFNSVLLSYGFMNPDAFIPGSAMMRNNPWLGEFDNNKRIGWIFRSLDLTPVQKDSIRGFLNVYHDSMKVLVKAFFNEIKDTIQNANVQRRAIVDSLKRGEINRQQAKDDLTALNQDTRNKIQNDQVVQSIKSDMCQQRGDLFNNVGSVLTADQLTKWNEMISKLKSPCSN